MPSYEVCLLTDHNSNLFPLVAFHEYNYVWITQSQEQNGYETPNSSRKTWQSDSIAKIASQIQLNQTWIHFLNAVLKQRQHWLDIFWLSLLKGGYTAPFSVFVNYLPKPQVTFVIEDWNTTNYYEIRMVINLNFLP